MNIDSYIKKMEELMKLGDVLVDKYYSPDEDNLPDWYKELINIGYFLDSCVATLKDMTSKDN